MRKKFLLILLFPFIVIFTSCDKTPSLTIGFNPQGTPFNLGFNTDGELFVSIGEKLLTPLGAFSISTSMTESYSFHTTYIEIYDRNKELKYVFQLSRGEEFKLNTKYETSITVIEKSNSTIVNVDSQEITDFIKIARDKEPKPHFAETPIPYFWLTKRINVDWSIHNVWDLLLDILFIIIYFFAIIIDLILIILFFVLRLVWLIIVGLYYIIMSIF